MKTKPVTHGRLLEIYSAWPGAPPASHCTHLLVPVGTELRPRHVPPSSRRGGPARVVGLVEVYFCPHCLVYLEAGRGLAVYPASEATLTPPRRRRT